MENSKRLRIAFDAPSFASGFIWELSYSEDEKRHYVRLKFNERYLKFCDVNAFDGFYCEFSKFEETMKERLILDDFKSVCGNGVKDLKETIRTEKIIIRSLIVLIVLLILVIFFLVSTNVKKNKLIRSVKNENVDNFDSGIMERTQEFIKDSA